MFRKKNPSHLKMGGNFFVFLLAVQRNYLATQHWNANRTVCALFRTALATWQSLFFLYCSPLSKFRFSFSDFSCLSLIFAVFYILCEKSHNKTERREIMIIKRKGKPVHCCKDATSKKKTTIPKNSAEAYRSQMLIKDSVPAVPIRQ